MIMGQNAKSKGSSNNKYYSYQSEDDKVCMMDPEEKTPGCGVQSKTKKIIKCFSKKLHHESSMPSAEGLQDEENKYEERKGLGKEKTKQTSKKVHFAYLSDNYEPLVEGESQPKESKQEKKYKAKQKCKKYRKNVGKAAHRGWKYFVAGLQGLATAYSSPWMLIPVLTTSVHR
ncbi:uncharacterized protein C1orf115 homolog [Protopterus annectens]|uniref:uncharacterized protein C1orf115 homolog n=1 Tax=Protopterus annectens TaxID=7888 RepID=UPI001CFBDAA1|nr:uncharacterized protein C1orf115 homolog [Protopterus annectens]